MFGSTTTMSNVVLAVPGTASTSTTGALRSAASTTGARVSDAGSSVRRSPFAPSLLPLASFAELSTVIVSPASR